MSGRIDIKARTKRIFDDINERRKFLSDERVVEDINNAVAVLRKQKKFPLGLMEALKDYRDGNENGVYMNNIPFGHNDLEEIYREFVLNPGMVWDIYDSVEDKDMLFYSNQIIPGDIESYKRVAVSMIFKTIFGYESEELIEKARKMSETEVNFLLEDMWLYAKEKVEIIKPIERKAFLSDISRVAKKLFVSQLNKMSKDWLIDSILEIASRLEVLGETDKSKAIYNERMQSMGLLEYIIPDGVTPVDKDRKFYGFDLKKCSTFQLEAMLAFYMNRIEKVQDKIGENLFAITSLEDFCKLNDIEFGIVKDNSGENKRKKCVSKALIGKTMRITEFDIEKLKLEKKKYAFISAIFLKMQEELEKEMISAVLYNNRTVHFENIYESIFEEYEEAYSEVLQDKNANLKDDVTRFIFIRGFLKREHYMNKNLLIEELIMKADEEKLNWGLIIEDDNKSVFRKYMTIGFDIPGLNMPLRLHCDQESLKRIILRNFNDGNIPLYVGNEDFLISGKNFGTQILSPITPKQRVALKCLGKETKNNSKWKSLIEHLLCMQLPNPVKKLLALKTNKLQLTQDYFNILTGKRTPGRRVCKEMFD